jgi:molecular chaperone GrpE
MENRGETTGNYSFEDEVGKMKRKGSAPNTPNTPMDDAPEAAPAQGAGADPEDVSSEQLAGQMPAEPSEDDVPQTPEQRMAALEVEREEVHQRLLRVSADYQNYVRRAGQNIQSARAEQLMDMARSLVVVLDHFDRALEIDPQSTSVQSLFDGMQIVRDELLRVLERFGVARLNVRPGDPFDPSLHEALMRQPTDEVPPGHVATQLQPGYVLGDKPVRAAQVTVAQAIEAEEADKTGASDSAESEA